MSTSRRQLSTPYCQFFLEHLRIALIACPRREQVPPQVPRSAQWSHPRDRLLQGRLRQQLPSSQPMPPPPIPWSELPLNLGPPLLPPRLPDLPQASPEPPLPPGQSKPLLRPPDWKNNY